MLKAMFQAMHVSPRLETLLPTPNIKDDTGKENAVKVPIHTPVGLHPLNIACTY